MGYHGISNEEGLFCQNKRKKEGWLLGNAFEEILHSALLATPGFETTTSFNQNKFIYKS